MKKLLILLFIPLVSFGQIDFLISPKYVEASDEQLAIMTNQSVIYHKENIEGKIKWAKETKEQTRMYYLKGGTKYDFILIKKQTQLNSNEFRMLIDSKSIEFLNMWNKMKEDMFNKEENDVVNVKVNFKLIDSNFGTLHNKYNYMYSKTKISSNNVDLPPYENTYWININNILYSIHIKSADKFSYEIDDIIIRIKD